MACFDTTLWPVPTCMYGWPASQHPGHWVQLITPFQCGKLLWGHFHWLVMTCLWPVMIAVKLVYTSISVCNFQSNCARARNTDVFEAPIWNVFWWTIGSSVADPVPVSYSDIRLCTVDSATRRTNLQRRDSIVVNRRTSNAKTRHWRPGRTHCTHQDVKIPDLLNFCWTFKGCSSK